MTLPNPPQRYDPKWAAELKRELESQLESKLTKDQDIELASGRVWLTSPLGKRFRLNVDDDGNLLTTEATGAATPAPPPPPPVGYRDASASIAATSSAAAVASVGVRLYQDGRAAIDSVSAASAAATIAGGTANLLTYSEQLDNAAWKQTLASGQPTIAKNVSADGAGNTTLEELTTSFTQGSYYVRYHLTGLVPGQTYTFHLDTQQGRSGSAANVRLTTNNTAAWNTGASASYALTSGVTRRSVSWTQQDTTTAAIMAGAVDASGTGDETCLGTMRLGRAMVNVGATAAPYVSSGEPHDAVDPPPPSGGLDKVFGVYFETYHAWREAPTPQIQDIPTEFNLIYLFHCKFNSNGSARWESATDVTASEIQTVRQRGQKLVVTLGGSGAAFTYLDRAQSQALVNSLSSIGDQIGGFDGIDWNNYEGGNLTSSNRETFANELIWVVQQVRDMAVARGWVSSASEFFISSPASPNEPNDQWVLQQMMRAGALSFANPQFYDWSGWSDPGRIKSVIDTWVNVMDGDASKVVVGFPGDYLSRWDGGNGPQTWQCQREWDAIKAAHPNIRGCFIWSSTSASGAHHVQYGYTRTENGQTVADTQTRLPTAYAPDRFRWIQDMYSRVMT